MIEMQKFCVAMLCDMSRVFMLCNKVYFTKAFKMLNFKMHVARLNRICMVEIFNHSNIL